MNQGGRLEGLVGGLVGHPRGGELAQLVVDEREQVGGGLAVTGRRGVQESRHVGHSANVTSTAGSGKRKGPRIIPATLPTVWPDAVFEAVPAPVRHTAFGDRRSERLSPSARETRTADKGWLAPTSSAPIFRQSGSDDAARASRCNLPPIHDDRE